MTEVFNDIYLIYFKSIIMIPVPIRCYKESQYLSQNVLKRIREKSHSIDVDPWME